MRIFELHCKILKTYTSTQNIISKKKLKAILEHSNRSLIIHTAVFTRNWSRKKAKVIIQSREIKIYRKKVLELFFKTFTAKIISLRYIEYDA